MELLLKDKAKAQQLSVEELALGILGHALENDEPFPTPEEVVAKIQATPLESRNIWQGRLFYNPLRSLPRNVSYHRLCLTCWRKLPVQTVHKGA